MFTFQHPWLAGFILAPFLARLLLPACKNPENGTMTELRHPYTARLQSAFYTGTFRLHKGREGITHLLLYFAFVCFVLAWMQPQKVSQFTEVKSEGYDLMLAVDLSKSMRALDFSNGTQRINRLDVTKQVVGDFVTRRSGDRIGLIVFADHAYLHVPLTLDNISVSTMLNNTAIGMAGGSTAIGDAIGLAVKTLRERKEKSRVLILLTDGDNTSGTLDPMEAARLAAQYGIRIYTIGVGSNDPVPFPRDDGIIVHIKMRLDEKLLKDVASVTGGHYFRATDKEGLEDIYNQINTLEKTEDKSRELVIRTPLYRIPLIAGMGLLLFVALLSFMFRRKGYA